MTFASGSKIGKYVLRRRLGHGGFGVVVAAHDTGLDREVALKFLKPEHAADPQVVQRFLREARAAAKVVHPGIVTIYEASEVRGTRTTLDGTAYIAMELLAGESLLDRRAKVGRMTAAMAIDLGRQLASALEAAHRAGIVHRDLKPEN
ncbi:MAG TPA: serine/threonine-protein kinase, partial [Kofleriaceae bacterium]